ncbi:MAG: metallophosphoesterase [Eubacterium sp.]|nr:metallophosphoesterase [Eubacterium sp.]
MALKLNTPLGKLMKDKAESYLFLDEGETVEGYLQRMMAAIKKALKDAAPDLMVIEFQTLLDLAPFDVENDDVKAKTDELISVIKEGIKESPIYMIRTNVPQRYITQRMVFDDSSKNLFPIRKVVSPNPNFEYESDNVSYVNKFEEYFAEKTGAKVIDSTAHYLYKKRNGYKLNYWTYEDECYKDISNEIISKVKAERKAPELTLKNSYKDSLTSEDNIIISENKNSKYRLGDDNVIYIVPAEEEAETEKSTDGYTIDISRFFIPESRDDDGLSYGEEYDKEVKRIIEKIRTQNPEQKVFNSIDPMVRAGYLAKLVSYNPVSVLKEIYDTPLDKIVLSLPAPVIRKNLKKIAGWYKKNYQTREEIMKNLRFSFNKELKESIAAAPVNDLMIIPELPKGYINEPWPGHLKKYNDPVPTAPQFYMRDEVEDTIRKVKKLSSPESLTFLLVTDIHYKSVNKKSKKPTEITFQRMLANMKAVLDKTDVSFVVNLGDDSDGNFQDKDDLMRASKYVTEEMLKLSKPYYRVLGNHDTNHYAKKLLSAEEMRDFYLYYIDRYEYLTFNPDSNNTEYYLDFPEQKIRMIVLNTEYGEIFAYSESTGKWLNEKALDTDYTILLAEHLSCLTTMNMNASPLKNRESVIEALKEHKRGPIVQLCGHSHCDYSFTDNDPEYSPWLTVFSNLQRCTRRRQYDIGDITVGHTKGWFGCPHRTGGKLSEDCWEIVIFNPVKRKVNLVRFGAGEDREFSY